MDVKLDTLLQGIYLNFVLHNYCQNKKENLPDQNSMSPLSFEKGAQPSTSSLSYGESVNENKPISIRNTFVLWIVYSVGITETKLKKSEATIQSYNFDTARKVSKHSYFWSAFFCIQTECGD